MRLPFARRRGRACRLHCTYGKSAKRNARASKIYRHHVVVSTHCVVKCNFNDATFLPAICVLTPCWTYPAKWLELLPMSSTDKPILPSSWDNPSVDGADLDIEVFPSVLMLGAATLYQRNVFRPIIEPYGLGIAEWRVLVMLNVLGTATAADIANRSWMDKAQISRAAAELEERGYIVRKADATHAKKRIMSATSTGQEVYVEIFRLARMRQAEILQLLTRDERHTLFSALNELIRYSSTPDSGSLDMSDFK